MPRRSDFQHWVWSWSMMVIVKVFTVIMEYTTENIVPLPHVVYFIFHICVHRVVFIHSEHYT